MRNRPLWWGLVDVETVIRSLFIGLLLALPIVADGYVLILLSRQFGIYLLLAAAASTGLVAVVLVVTVYRNELDAMWSSIGKGVYPRRQFRRLITLLAAAGMLLIPGFVTDAIGVLLLIRPIGWVVGALVERIFRERFRELYEYLRLAA